MFKGARRPLTVQYITRLREIGRNNKIDIFKFFTLNYIFIFIIINLHKKCDLLRYITLVQLKKMQKWEGGLYGDFYCIRSPPMGPFFSYTNIMYIKRSHFYRRFMIVKIRIQPKVKNLKKVNFTIFTHVTQACYEVKL